MDLRSYSLLVLLSCFSYGHSFSASYLGSSIFKIGTNASLSCTFEPIPENVTSIDVGWYIIGDNLSSSGKKIASNKGNGDSFIYDTAPDYLKDRFSVSSERLTDGTTDASIQRVGIIDEGFYACDIEDSSSNSYAQVKFEVSVYQLPTVSIGDVMTEIDIRKVQPVPTTVAPASDNSTMSENSDDVPSDSANAENNVDDVEEVPADTSSNDETSEETNEESVPADERVVVAKCMVDNVYPKPNSISFRSSKGMFHIADDADITSVTNPDGTFNVTADLRITPTSELNQATISCAASVTNENLETQSGSSEAINVLYDATEVDVVFNPSSPNEGDVVSIKCRANGNPSPPVTLTTPDENSYDVTGTSHDIQSIGRDAKGTYTCSAADLEKSKYLEVYYMSNPTIQGPSSVNQGDAGSLECKVETNADITYVWTKNGVIVSDADTYQFSNSEATDSGEYICEVSSQVGMKAATHSLIVQADCQPEIVKSVSSSTEDPENFHVEVTCTASGTPACTMEMTGYEDVQPVSSPNLITLTIKNMPKQDQKFEVTCNATNTVSATQTKTVEVEEVCCNDGGDTEPSSAGPGVIIIIVVVVLLTVIGVAVGCYVMRTKRQSKQANITSEKAGDDIEGQKLTTPEEVQA